MSDFARADQSGGGLIEKHVHALERAQAIIRRRVPSDRRLAYELLEERRREALR